MREGHAIVRAGRVERAGGDPGPMPAASLVKPVLAHLALAVLDELDEPVHGAITVRHVLSHTTGLPDREPGSPAGPLPPLRPPGVRWGYSGEGFVLLGRHLERRTGRPLNRLVAEQALGPLGMADSALRGGGPSGRSTTSWPGAPAGGWSWACRSTGGSGASRTGQPLRHRLPR